jgi:hypothetical protein
MNNKFVSIPGLFVFCLVSTINNSCADAPPQTKIEDHKVVMKKPPASFSDTLHIHFPAAVFYSPDSLQYEKIRAVTDPRIFEGSMHEYYYLMRNAKIAIAKTRPRMKIIETKNVRYLLFVQDSMQRHCIDLNSKNDAYGLFFFDGTKPPLLSDMANIETDLGAYFVK